MKYLLTSLCLLLGGVAWAEVGPSRQTKIRLHDEPLTTEWVCVQWGNDKEELERGTLLPLTSKEFQKKYWCIREIGYVSNGEVRWRRPPQAVKDAKEREQKSNPYK